MRLNRSDFDTDNDYITFLEQRCSLLDSSRRILFNAIEAIGRHAEEHSDRHRSYGGPSYSYIPFDHSVFLDSMTQFYQDYFCHWKRQPRFLDVGCGIGDKVYLASNIGFNAHGIDFDPYLLRRAKRLYCVGPDEDEDTADFPTAECADALTYNYSAFDVIYFYRPFQVDAIQSQLERRIYQQAKFGAYIVPIFAEIKPHKTNYDLVESYSFAVGGIDVYQRVCKGRRRVKRVRTNQN